MGKIPSPRSPLDDVLGHREHGNGHAVGIARYEVQLGLKGELDIDGVGCVVPAKPHLKIRPCNAAEVLGHGDQLFHRCGQYLERIVAAGSDGNVSARLAAGVLLLVPLVFFFWWGIHEWGGYLLGSAPFLVVLAAAAFGDLRSRLGA